MAEACVHSRRRPAESAGIAMHDGETGLMHRMFDRYLEALERTQWMPPAQLSGYQRDLLERIVRHAYERVPFYRDRLACLFTRHGEVDIARWREVPIVSRHEAALNGAQMHARTLPEDCGPVREIRTSGSTGIPLTVASNALVRIAGNAAATRFARWWGAETTRPLARIKIVEHDKPAPYPHGRDWTGWSFTSPATPAHDLDMLTPPQRQIEWLLRKKAPYLTTTSSNALALAYAVTSEQAREMGIEIVFLVGETVLARTRELVPQRLGAKVGAVYSCEEIGFIATECPLSSCYHVVAENVVVEVLGDDGAPVAPGEIGRVVVTSLYNYAMPFIRYAIGDVATAGAQSCPCGRSLPVLAQVEGRTRHAFVFRDGTRVWPRIWTLTDIAALVPHRECQLAQVDQDTIEVRYVPDSTGRTADAAGLADYVQRKFHPSARARLVPMTAIPRNRGGKFDPFVSVLNT